MNPCVGTHRFFFFIFRYPAVLIKRHRHDEYGRILRYFATKLARRYHSRVLALTKVTIGTLELVQSAYVSLEPARIFWEFSIRLIMCVVKRRPRKQHSGLGEVEYEIPRQFVMNTAYIIQTRTSLIEPLRECKYWLCAFHARRPS